MGNTTRLGVLSLALLALACESEKSTGTAGSGGSGASSGGTTGGASGTGGSGGTGGASGSGGGAATSGAGGTGGTAGTGGSGGAVTGGTGASGTGGSGGVSGSSGSGGGAAEAGTGGTSGTAGTGGSGGTSVCNGGPYPAPDWASASPTLVHTESSADLLEGPVWVASQGALFFSGMSSSGPSNIFELVPPSTVTTFVSDVQTNGLALSASDLIVACRHDIQGLGTFSPVDATPATLVTDYQGNSFNSPNDLTIRSDGVIYFTDPDWQLNGRTPSPVGMGVYRVMPGGAVELVDASLDKPNGIALSLDETVLYVADYNGGGANGRIGTYPVNPDGSTGSRSDFATGLAVPDGMTVDCAGNLYAAENEAGAISVYAPDGAELGQIQVTRSLTNLAFGGPDRMTLYATAGTSLYAIQMNLPGRPY